MLCQDGFRIRSHLPNSVSKEDSDGNDLRPDQNLQLNVATPKETPKAFNESIFENDLEETSMHYSNPKRSEV